MAPITTATMVVKMASMPRIVLSLRLQLGQPIDFLKLCHLEGGESSGQPMDWEW